jgi:hypothetical protein
MEEESSELRKKLIEKEREYERLQSELTIAQKRSKSSMSRSRYFCFSLKFNFNCMPKIKFILSSMLDLNYEHLRINKKFILLS